MRDNEEQDSINQSQKEGKIFDRFYHDFQTKFNDGGFSIEHNIQPEQQEDIKENKFVVGSEYSENEKEEKSEVDIMSWRCERCGKKCREVFSQEYVYYIAGSPSMEL